MGTKNKKGLLWREVNLNEPLSHLYLPQKARPPVGTCQGVHRLTEERCVWQPYSEDLDRFKAGGGVKEDRPSSAGRPRGK
jgi:hypothetical protein